MAKTISFLTKHSSAADKEQTATMFLLPNLRVKTGPHLFERIASTLCIGGFETRWRWPMIGKPKGLGGKLRERWNTSLNTRKLERKKARQ